MPATDVEAKKAAKYAVSVTYPPGKTTSKLVTAQFMYLWEIKYGLTVSVTFTGNRTCSMQYYVVWRDVPTSKYTLESKTAMPSLKCRSK